MADYEEIFEENVGRNILFVVDRDMENQLDAFYGVGAYPDFAEKTFGNVFRREFPFFVIDPSSVSPTEGEHFIEGQMSFGILLGVVDDDPITVSDLLLKYVRAFRAVIRSAARTDFLRNIAVNTVMPFTVNLSYTYTQVEKNPNKPNSWMRGIEGELAIQFAER